MQNVEITFSTFSVLIWSRLTHKVETFPQVCGCIIFPHLGVVLFLLLSSVYPSMYGKSLYRELRQPSPHHTKINVIKMADVRTQWHLFCIA